MAMTPTDAALMGGRMHDQLVAGAQQSLLEASPAARRAADPQSLMVDAVTATGEADGREWALGGGGGRMHDQPVAAAQQSLLEASHAARRAADPQSFMVDAFTEIVEAYGRESALAARDVAVADYAARGARVSPGEIDLSAPVFEQADSSARWAVFGAGD